VRTALGIYCGYDDSAYAYEWSDGHWRRFWEHEQTDYDGAAYEPQLIYQVQVVRPPGNPNGDRLVLTTGMNPWCQSNFQAVYYQLWRVHAGQSKLLLNGNDYNYIAADPPIQGSVGEHDALVEFAIPSLDIFNLHHRGAVRHYRIDGDSVARIDPIALDPEGFLEEWLTNPWSNAAAWSDRRSQPLLERWHREFAGRTTHVARISTPALRCRNHALWQIDIAFGDPEAEPPPTYLLIRWEPPYHFTMTGAGHRPFPGCTEKVTVPGALGTLFPVQDWR
jgi:hypothetical protein